MTQLWGAAHFMRFHANLRRNLPSQLQLSNSEVKSQKSSDGQGPDVLALWFLSATKQARLLPDASTFSLVAISPNQTLNFSLSLSQKSEQLLIFTLLTSHVAASMRFQKGRDHLLVPESKIQNAMPQPSTTLD